MCNAFPLGWQLQFHFEVAPFILFSTEAESEGFIELLESELYPVHGDNHCRIPTREVKSK